MRRAVLAVILLLLLGACAPAMNRDQVAQVLRDNPQIVFDALKRDKSQLLDVLDQAAQEREAADRKAELEQGLAHRLEPVLDAERPFLGPADAPVTIVEYSDFLCGYCAQSAQALQELMRRHPGSIRLFFKHYPAHPGALEPALVFEALGLQDKDAAWRFADLAFANQQALSDVSGKGLAALLTVVENSAKDGGKVKIDTVRLKVDMAGQRLRQRIEGDVAEAGRFGVAGTPTFIVNGVEVRGAQTLDEFEALLQTVAPATFGKAAK
jgi:Protein-disulfide isomerase